MLKPASEIAKIVKNKLYHTSQVEHIVKKIGECIQKEAEQGNYSLKVDAGCAETWEDVSSYKPNALILGAGSNVEHFGLKENYFDSITETLIDNGYFVSFTKSKETYVPAGLRDDDGNGPLYVNVNLVISWKDES